MNPLGIVVRFARYVLVALLGLCIAGCSSGASTSDIFVRVIPPGSGVPWPPERLILEVSDQAWQMPADGGGGVATFLDASTSEPVRLVRSTDCAFLYRFEAQVGRKYTLKVSPEGKIASLDETTGAYGYGPGLAATQPSGCGA